MKNLWPEKFHELDVVSSKSFLEEQGRLLDKITGGIVHGEVREVDALDSPVRLHTRSAEFTFRFDIVGKFANDYRFKLFDFGHDIALYPVTFVLDLTLGRELRLDPNRAVFTATSPSELESLAEAVFKSERVRNVIGAIMKLSK